MCVCVCVLFKTRTVTTYLITSLQNKAPNSFSLIRHILLNVILLHVVLLKVKAPIVCLSVFPHWDFSSFPFKV